MEQLYFLMAVSPLILSPKPSLLPVLDTRVLIVTTGSREEASILGIGQEKPSLIAWGDLKVLDLVATQSPLYKLHILY